VPHVDDDIRNVDGSVYKILGRESRIAENKRMVFIEDTFPI